MNEQNCQFSLEATYSASFQSYSSISDATVSHGIWDDDPAIAGVCYQHGDRVVSYAAPYGVTVIQPSQTHVTEHVRISAVSNTSGMYNNECVTTSYSSYASTSHGVPSMDGYVEPSYCTYNQGIAFQQVQSNNGYVQEYQAYHHQSSLGSGGDFQPDYSCHSQGTMYAASCSRVAGGVESGGMASYYEQVEQYSQSQQYGDASFSSYQSTQRVSVVQSVDVMESAACRTQSCVPMFADWNNERPACLDRPVALQAIEWSDKGDSSSEQKSVVVIEEVDDVVDHVSFPENEEPQEMLAQQEGTVASATGSESASPPAEEQCFVSLSTDKIPERASSSFNPMLNFRLNTNKENLQCIYEECTSKTTEEVKSSIIKTDSPAAESSESNLSYKDDDEDLPFADEKYSSQTAEKSDPKSDALPSKDTTTASSGWRGYLKTLSGFAGRALEEVATCYIKGLLL